MMIKVPTRRQSTLTLGLGILTVIIGFFQMIIGMSSALSYRGDGGMGLFFGILAFVFGFALISLGNRQVIDQDHFIIFLRDFIKKESEKH